MSRNDSFFGFDKSKLIQKLEEQGVSSDEIGGFLGDKPKKITSKPEKAPKLPKPEKIIVEKIVYRTKRKAKRGWSVFRFIKFIVELVGLGYLAYAIFIILIGIAILKVARPDLPWY